MVRDLSFFSFFFGGGVNVWGLDVWGVLGVWGAGFEGVGLWIVGLRPLVSA